VNEAGRLISRVVKSTFRLYIAMASSYSDLVIRLSSDEMSCSTCIGIFESNSLVQKLTENMKDIRIMSSSSFNVMMADIDGSN